MSIKNNNPTNLVYVEANKWQGLSTPPNDGRFCSFVSAVYGIRAGCMNLIAYQDRHGCNTITKIISKWAPISENDTAAYIGDVVGRSGFSADQELNLHTYADLRTLVEAMIWHECGAQPYSNSQFDEAIKMAGVLKPTPPWIRNPKVLAPTLTATATAAQQAIAQIQPIKDGLVSLGVGSLFTPHVILALTGIVAICGIGWIGYDQWKSHRAIA